jgi:hypothetical protein
MKHYQTLIRNEYDNGSNDFMSRFVEHQNQELEWDR